jgi:hypothetical protein
MPHELLGKNVNNITDSDMFRTESNSTNISLNKTDATYNFYGTNCTVFDFYYFFSACPDVEICSNTFGKVVNQTYGTFY